MPFTLRNLWRKSIIIIFLWVLQKSSNRDQLRGLRLRWEFIKFMYVICNVSLGLLHCTCLISAEEDVHVTREMMRLWEEKQLYVVITKTFKRLVHVYLSDTRIYYTFDFDTHLDTTYNRGGKPTFHRKNYPRVIKHFVASNVAGGGGY